MAMMVALSLRHDGELEKVAAEPAIEPLRSAAE
jgi:hypothetical protein